LSKCGSGPFLPHLKKIPPFTCTDKTKPATFATMLHKYIKSPHSSLGLDAWGMLASGLCAVHCLAIPVLLALGASAGVAWLETPWLESLLLITAIGLAAQSLVGSYRREHGRPLALWVAGAGFAVLVASRLAPEDLEHYLTAVGGFAIATAHWINWKLRRQACLACR